MRLTPLSLLLAALAGCAQRSVTINSDPPNALVYINQVEVGRTPMKYDFRWYGDYDVILRKEGYDTLKTNRVMKAPLNAIPPFDLLGELFGAKDRQEWTFQMTPASPQAVEAAPLINRGESLALDLRSSQYTRQPSTLPTTLPTGK